MWVATCPRCGFAVRWAPRAAREPARIWARLRALNLRLGVATAGVQFGAALLLACGGLIEGESMRGASLVGPSDMVGRYGAAFAVAIIAGCFIGAAAATAAPFRPLPRVLAAVWLATLAFASVVWLFVLASNYSPTETWLTMRGVLSRLTWFPEPTLISLGTMLVTSAAAAWFLRSSIGRGVAIVARRTTRARRATLATARAVHRRAPA